MFRVVRDRERWFQIITGENYMKSMKQPPIAGPKEFHCPCDSSANFRCTCIPDRLLYARRAQGTPVGNRASSPESGSA
jgi:hypothetical protein